MSGKLLNVPATAGNLATNRIFPHKFLPFEAFLDFSHQLGKLLYIFGCLREEVGVLRKVQSVHIFQMLNHNGCVLRLPLQTYHLGVAWLAENHYLAVRAASYCLVLFADALL